MIARLSSAGLQSSSRPLANADHQETSSSNQQLQQQSAAQSKRKRAKLIDLLLTANWSKQSQQVPNLMKLNKILLACDTNFLDEKTGESPLSLAINSPQIHQATLSLHNQQQPLLAASCAQSASLFNLQCQSASLSSSNGAGVGGGGINQLMLQQTSKSEIIQSKAPLIERILLLLVKSGAQIDFRNSDERTPLHIAAIKSNFWALKTLLDLGAATDYRDINGLTPLYYSILNKAALKVTQLLLIQSKANSSLSLSRSTNLTSIAGADPNDNRLPVYGITDQHGWQEVHQACKLGLDAHLEKLLYYGCDINAKISGSGNTPLHVAAINDQLNCAKVLLMRGADKTITNNSHQTAHQVAVISNNMEMAEFIAEHNESKVVPFQNQSSNHPTDRSHHHYLQKQPQHQNNDRVSLRNSSMANSFSLANISANGQHQPRHIVQQQVVAMKPLRLDVAPPDQQQHNSMMTADSTSTSSNCGFSSGTGSSQPQSLLSISALLNTNCQQLNVQVNNISPCLSQRSCATSNTTSSSGVCCDGEGSNSAEEINHQQLVQQYQQQLQPAQQSQLTNSLSQHSSLTMLTIDNNNNNDSNGIGCYGGKTDNNKSTFVPGTGSFSSLPYRTNNDEMHDASATNRTVGNEGDVDDGHEDEDDDDLKSSGSSSNGLYSLMSEERPLFVGSIVEAASDYQSGDPSHLQLRRGDLIEVLDYTADQLQFGQLPRLANKPMLYGKRKSDGISGLFPSFCVNRTKQSKSALRQRLPTTGSFINNNSLTRTTEIEPVNAGQIVTQLDASHMAYNEINQNSATDTRNLHGSQSLSMLLNRSDQQMNLNQPKQQMSSQTIYNENANQQKMKFKEIQVTLTKSTEGFGFALRGAKVDPSTLAGDKRQSNKFIIDERLMAANNLVSLQYLDEIEKGGPAHRANLKRGDFIVAVNGQDVRLHSHEQVVSLIRQSGNRVNLSLATPCGQEMQASSYTSKTLPKIKPEPPKRDPNTTLTRNRAQRVKSMFIQMNHQHEQLQKIDQMEAFDSNRPLPLTPSAESLQSPNGSLNMVPRYPTTSLSHNYHSAQSLSSTATDSQSISSASTLSTDRQSFDQQHHHQHQIQQHNQNLIDQTTPTHSSSSTTTLTTVAAMNPKGPAKKLTSESQICEVGSAIGDVKVSTSVAPVSTNQQIYQPAIIMTTKRHSMSSKSNLDSSPKSTLNANPMAEGHSPTPPPPPPLPDFTPSPTTTSRISQRRISAPIDLSSAELLKNGRNLLKKRESLAVVSQTTPQGSQDAPVPAQFGAVAAACAAAANNRLLRQQQQQQDSVQTPELSEKVQQLKLDDQIREAPSSPEPPPLPPPLPPQHQNIQPAKQPQPLQQQQQQQLHLHQTKQSRPQQQQLQQTSHQDHHHHHHHHNHRHQQQKQMLVDQQHFQPIRNHNQHNHSNEYQAHYHPEMAHATKRPASGIIQQQQAQQHQLFLLHQQHLLQQQLRQQQLLQQQQQQLKLQQQAQLQQRLCLYGKHGLSLLPPGTQDDHLTHAHTNNHTHLDHNHRAYDTYDNHHHHHNHDHQNANRCYDTSTTRSRHQCRRLNN